jgi:putative membrane protein
LRRHDKAKRVTRERGAVNPGSRLISTEAPPAFGALAVGAAGIAAASLLPLGPLSTHMAIHVGLMNVLAPIAAILLVRKGAALPGAQWLWGATAVQLLLLWSAHAPLVHAAAAQSTAFFGSISAALFLAALFFWLAIVSRGAAVPWREIFALLTTAKLACLLGALLAFAPYPLFAGPHHPLDLADQQQAGLLMLAACPLSYVLAGVVLAARMLSHPSPAHAPARPIPGQAR